MPPPDFLETDSETDMAEDTSPSASQPESPADPASNGSNEDTNDVLPEAEQPN